jgi:multicomponent Na+:H+ antiporter subunit G
VNEVISLAFMFGGGGLMLLGAVGIVRMPDVFSRLQAAAKASSLGLGLIVTGAALEFGEVTVVIRCIAIVLFGFLTLPVAAHMIGRAAYLAEEPLWEGTIVDELRGRYDREQQTLHSKAAAPDAAE